MSLNVEKIYCNLSQNVGKFKRYESYHFYSPYKSDQRYSFSYSLSSLVRQLGAIFYLRKIRIFAKSKLFVLLATKTMRVGLS